MNKFFESHKCLVSVKCVAADQAKAQWWRGTEFMPQKRASKSKRRKHRA
jgi:hypothetical protein